MNISSNAKKSLCHIQTKKEHKLALLSAVIHTCAMLCRSKGGTVLRIVSSNPDLHTLVSSLVSELELLENPRFSTDGRDSVLEKDALELLAKTRIIQSDGDSCLSFTEGIPDEFRRDDETAKVYLRGVFLGAGSFSESSWHLEIGVTDEKYSQAIAELMTEIGLTPHLFSRKDKYVVYLKKREDICDFFGHIGATRTMFELIEMLNTNKTRRDAMGKTNLEFSNIERTVNVGVEQINAIKLIDKKMGLSTLGDKLYEVAKLRLTSSELSYDDMAEALGISKGSVKYRLKKIMELSATLN